MAADLTLAIETSGPRGGVAVAAGGRIIAAREMAAERAYSSELFPTIRSILRDAGHTLRDVSVFCFSSGPGSFTGLRVAATIGRMMQSTCGCRVVAVPTLDVIAHNALTGAASKVQHIAVVLDAKRSAVYGAAYAVTNSATGDRDLPTLRLIAAPAVYDPASWLAGLPRPFVLLGAGVGVNRAACDASGGEILDESHWHPRVATVALLGMLQAAAGVACQPEEIVPLYIRPPECEEVYDQRRAEARARRGA